MSEVMFLYGMAAGMFLAALIDFVRLHWPKRKSKLTVEDIIRFSIENFRENNITLREFRRQHEDSRLD